MSSSAIVHIIDDDDAVRDSLVFLLKSSGIEAKAYASAANFLDGFAGTDKGCVVTDIRMPEISGMELLKRVKEKRPELPVIVITGHGDVPLAVEAMKLGAADFLEKPFDDDSLIAAVQAALAGDRDRGGRDEQASEFRTRLETLSAREREVLEGLVAGHPNKVIAFDLGISPRTVEVYRANVMTKMRASTLSELVRMAVLSNST
jgi:two-component system response regulator FixJ